MNCFRDESFILAHGLTDSFALSLQISIDDDILNLMDEVNLDEFLKEAASAIDNPDMLAEYIREKATIAIERFLVSCLIHTDCRICFLSCTAYSRWSIIELFAQNVYSGRKT